MAFVLGIMGSPRREGNTELLLSAFLEGVRRNGLQVRKLYVAEQGIAPCMGCRYCEREGFCKLSDGMDDVYRLLRRADLVVLATPIFFYGTPAQTKALIDRVQALWSRKYRLGLQDPKAPWRKGFLLAVGATKGKNLFAGVELTAKYFFDSLGASFEGTLGFRQVDKPGDIAMHPTALEEARARGRELSGGLSRRRRVLFLCRENARRSQMAEALLQRYAGDRFDADSAGEEPAPEIDPLTMRVMAEKGMDLAYRRPKGAGEVFGQGPFDLLVRMGCEVSCPAVSALQQEEWDLEDPAGGSPEAFQRVRDEIENRVKDLISRFGK